MPTISSFLGIIISMYFKDHNPPHIHAKYHGEEAQFSIDGDLISGSFPKKQRKIVEAWIELRREELLENWERAKENGDLFPIDPIR